MADKTAIEWTDATWNPIRGTKGMWSCVKVSEGCQNCYAERLNEYRGGPPYVVGSDTLQLDEEILTQPLRWKRARRIFVCSMTDLFEERISDKWLYTIFDVMAQAQQHTFQILTKRAERMADFCGQISFIKMEELAHLKAPGLSVSPLPRSDPRPLPNVWLGISVENQVRAKERIPWLLKTPAAVRFLSVEPLLGPISFRWADWVPWPKPGGKIGHLDGLRGLHWVIVGGESGGPPKRALAELYTFKRKDLIHYPKSAWYPKPEALEWVRNLRDECVAAGVPFFFKQWGGAKPKSGGRLLDGKEWSEYPR